MVLTLVACLAAGCGQRPEPGEDAASIDVGASGTCAECGPQALFTIASLRGISTTEQEVFSLSEPGLGGATFGQLRDAAETLGFDAVLDIVSWDDLASRADAAILWVNGDHYVAAVRKPGDDAVLIYDTRRIAQRWTRQMLEEVWSGEALLLSGVGSGGVVLWESTLVDEGSIVEGDEVRFVFRGFPSGEVIEAEIAGIGCGCSEASVVGPLSPGDSLEVHVDVDTTGKRGFFRSHVDVVVTENGRSEAVTLYVQLDAQTDRIASHEILAFGAVSRRALASQWFAMFDERSERIEVRSVTAKVSDPRLSDFIRVDAAQMRIEPENPALHSDFAMIRAGDILVNTTVTVADGAPSGPFRGEVTVSYAEGSTEREFVLPFSGQVRSGSSVSPAVLMLDPNVFMPERGGAVTLLVKGESALPEIDRVTVSSKYLTIREGDLSIEPSADDDRTVRVLLPLNSNTREDDFAFDDLGSVVIQTSSGDELVIPLISMSGQSTDDLRRD